MTTYVKKTWTTNEVIETAEMNNIETGIDDGFKFSEQIIDSNKDMQGYDLSNLGRVEVAGVMDTDANGVAVPSSTVQASLDAEGSYAGPATLAWVDGPNFTLTSGFSGSANGFAVGFDAKMSIALKPVYIRLLINSAEVYKEYYDSTTYKTIRQYALGVQQGDVIKLQVQSASAEARSATIKNVRLYGDFVVKTVGVDGATITGSYT